MDIEIAYWHWLVFGMLLIIAELLLPSFTIFWFGLGALVVAALLFFVPDMPLPWQLAAWAVSSSVMTFLWLKYFRKIAPDRTSAGVGREAVIGERGTVSSPPDDKGHGRVRFTRPVLGSSEWLFICTDEVAIGDIVYIKDISGNTLIVEKTNPV
ncbi:MAG: NfeD family protein [Candidatus Dadabacteria bacterium]|jgi:inner membrane protein|nr:NfeD family protein [Candidatus Dadabacteria bacterium]